ncbi:MAG: DUF1080 domain-containing protein [Opitutaceae bacterium]
MPKHPILLILTVGATLSSASGEWASLFNGRDLTGWHQANGAADYAVADGAIVGTPVSDSPNSFLVTDDVFGDFIFECEVKVDGIINSGIQFRSLSTADFKDGRVHGYQCEIDEKTDRNWTGGIYDEARRGWLYRLELNPSAKSAYRPGDWNHLRIECVGSSLRTWVNGIATAHLIDDATARGVIGLQVHSIGSRSPEGKRIHWRNLRIRTDVAGPTPPEGVFVRNTVPISWHPRSRPSGGVCFSTDPPRQGGVVPPPRPSLTGVGG